MWSLRRPTYKWEEVVIGGNLNALFYTYKKGCHIIPNIMDIPFAYDRPRLENNLGLDADSSQQEWHYLAYSLNQMAKNPFANKVEQIRVDPENKKLIVNIGTLPLFDICYKKLHVFDTENVHGLPDDQKEHVRGYQIYDWYDVRSGMLHDLDSIEDEKSEFVKKVHFFLSERIDGNYEKKDLVAESFLTEKELHDINYSESLSRLKTISMMKNAGIKGKKNGSGSHVSIRLELWKRQIKKLKNIKTFKKDDIIIDGRSLEEITNEFSSSRDYTVSRPTP
jgi:hypothetical protein